MQRDEDVTVISDDLLNHPMNTRSCDKCDKFITCFVFRDFGKVIAENMGRSDPSKYPINPFHIAQICGLYHEKGTPEECANCSSNRNRR